MGGKGNPLLVQGKSTGTEIEIEIETKTKTESESEAETKEKDTKDTKDTKNIPKTDTDTEESQSQSQSFGETPLLSAPRFISSIKVLFPSNENALDAAIRPDETDVWLQVSTNLTLKTL